MIPVVAVALYWWRAPRDQRWRLVWQLILGGAIAGALALLGGHLFYDTRPFVADHVKPLFSHAPDNGFPSDHALLASFLAFLMLGYSRRLGGVLLVVALLIGGARVAAHVHSWWDILGSFAFSAVGVLVARQIDARRSRAAFTPWH